jgi:hypothetical protein
VVELPPETWLQRNERAAGVVAAVREGFADAFRQLSTEDVSGWLVGLTENELDAVLLRDSGGIYFVPRHKLELLRSVVAVVAEVSEHKINLVPAMPSADAVSAVLDAVESEAGREASAIEEALTSGELGAKAAARRVETVQAIERKVARYEALMGTKLDALRERLGELRGGLALAAMTSGAARKLA